MTDKMLDQFKQSLKNIDVQPTQKVLVAISGGADSVALAHLFMKVEQPIILAHCNFNLRGAESDADEQFVRNFAIESNLPLFTKSFNTEAFAKQNGISIEMAARELRYNWFAELCKNEGCKFIATGHHKNDSVETFFLNLNRGTGIKGLMGISEINGQIIRPLLSISRQEIEEYIRTNKLSYCTDATNFENHYLRNKFRNQVLPVLTEINPLFSEKVLDTMEHLKQVYDSFKIRLQEIEQQIIITDGERVIISQTLVNQLPDKNILMFEILSKFGFNSAQTTDILVLNNQQSGQQFFSSTHRLIKDRHNYIILAKTERDNETYYFNNEEQNNEAPIKLAFYEIPAQDFILKHTPNVAYFDADNVEFPLTLRHWQQGDSFRPLGMTGFKKLSDFFIDQKFSNDQKETCWLLLSGDDIMWIINHRIDDRFKLSNKTKRILRIEVK